MSDIKILVNDLMAANERGLAPPQNWTHRAIDAIQSLTTKLSKAEEERDKLRLQLSEARGTIQCFNSETESRNRELVELLGEIRLSGMVAAASEKNGTYWVDKIDKVLRESTEGGE